MSKKQPKEPQAHVEAIMRRMEEDRTFRIGLTTASHEWFLLAYFAHHTKHALARMHREIIALTEDPALPLGVVVAFRGSGKSTIVSQSFPIWAALSGRKKFILIISKTEAQVKQIMYNIKAELEGNPILLADYGPLNRGDVWNELSLVLPTYTAKIVGISTEQSLRGFRHRSHRPDLVILDDVEDLDSVRTQESREKRYRWFKSEVIPAGGDSCQIYVVGNLLHEESLVSKLRQEIEDKEISGVYRHYPILTKNLPAWPGKFTDPKKIDALRMKIGDDRAYRREYLLEITSEIDQVILPEWVMRYETLLDEGPHNLGPGWRYAFTATGIDLAISQRESADYTAMVTAAVYKRYDDRGFCRGYRIYVLPIVTNRHLTFEGTIQAAKLTKSMTNRESHRFYVEDVAYQRAAIETMKRAGMTTYGVSPEGMDKRARLTLAAREMELGNVVFPKTGCEDVIRQLVGFGAERHDDLADAFSMLVIKATKDVNKSFGIWRL